MRFMLKPCIVAVLALVCTLTSQCAVAQDAPPTGGTPVALPAGVTVVASGLTNPRGFTWGADGTLYLTLAGVGAIWLGPTMTERRPV
jgi:glucose/arabinose dehydrogenase